MALDVRVPLLPPEHAKPTPNQDVRPMVWVSLVSGAVSGAVAKTTIAPLDRTKIYFQVSNSPYSWSAVVRYLRSSWSSRSLWRGNSATMARIVPYSAVQFAAHEQWRALLGVSTKEDAKRSRAKMFLAGSLAGVTSQSATYPLDLARARMAVSPRGGLLAVLRERARGGLPALYRGYLATVLGVIPYAGVSFFTYNTLKTEFQERVGSSQGVANLVLGGVAGVLGQSSSYPLDVVRRRLQTCSRTLAHPILHTIQHIYSTEGWRGFFKGLSMNWIKGPIAVGISFSTYDLVRSHLAALHR